MASRTRAPAHMNVYGFKHNPGSKKTAVIAAIPNTRVCKRCHDIIEWRKKYRKYKPLTKPGKCIGCTQRRVKFAYHQLCGECAHDKGVCAKCMEQEAVTDVDALKEALKKEIEFLEGTKGAIPGLSERERRTLLRETYKKAQAEGYEVEDLSERRAARDEDGSDDDGDGEGVPGRKHGRVPRAPGAADGGDDAADDDAEAEYAAAMHGGGHSAHALSSQDEAEIAMLRAALRAAKARAGAMDGGRRPVAAAAAVVEAVADPDGGDEDEEEEEDRDADDDGADEDDEEGAADEEEVALGRRIPNAGVVTSSSVAPAAATGYARLLAAAVPDAVLQSDVAPGADAAAAPAATVAVPLHERIARLVVEPKRPSASAAAVPSLAIVGSSVPADVAAADKATR